MESLPWELIGQIGGFLAPKWRCRLYICNKLWHTKCYFAHNNNALFLHMAKMCSTLKLIKSISYKVIGNSVSKLVKPNGNIIYSENGIKCHHGNVYVYAPKYRYEFVNGYYKYRNRSTDIHISKYRWFTYLHAKNIYLRAKLQDMDLYRYKWYKIVSRCQKCRYISKVDLLRFIMALGRKFYYTYKKL
jgi:hypothetical protein